MNLKQEIDKIKIIDHHLHAMDPWCWNDAIGVVPPFPPHIMGLDIPSKATSLAKTRKMMGIFKELFGFPYDSVTPDNRGELEAAYEKAKVNEAELYHKAMDMAGIERANQVCISRLVLPTGLDPNRFGLIALTDGLIIPLDNTELKKPTQKANNFCMLSETFMKRFMDEHNVHPHTFDEWLNFIDFALDTLKSEGCVAAKSSCGYWRGLDFEFVSEDEARQVFDAKDTTPDRYKRLQDYLQFRVFAKCTEIGLPFHMHTGGGGQEAFMRGNDPSLLDAFMWHPAIMNCKLVLLHGGYPYCREAGFMVNAVGQRPRPMLLDLSLMWMDAQTPGSLFLRSTLRDWLESGIAHKLIYGSDGVSPMRVWISASSFREDLASALTDMVSDGLVSDEQALSMAYQVLRGNAEKLYGL